MFGLIWSRRQLLLASVRIALRQRHAGTVLGLSWIALGPICLLGLYALVYLVIFRVRPVAMDANTYVLYIFAGLVPLMAFNQGLMQGTTSLSADRDVLLNTIYPPELVPLREISTSIVSLVVGLVIIFVLGCADGKLEWTWLLVPIVLLLLFAFLLGLVWVLALANLVLKDVQQVLTYVSMIILIASPIAYTPEMVPAALRPLIYLNPLAYFVVAFQSLIVLGRLPPPMIMTGVVLFAAISLSLGAWVFSRAKAAFFDYA